MRRRDAIEHAVTRDEFHETLKRVTRRPPCTCEQFGNGVVSGNDGRLPPAEGCPRHGKSPW